MSKRECDDCRGAGVDERLHAEIATVLREGEMDVFACSDLAADAIDLAEAEASITRASRFGWRPALIAAATVLAGVALWALFSTPRRDESPQEAKVVAGSVAEERAANVAFLAEPDTQARLAAVPDGQWVGIQHGKTFLVADELGRLHLMLKQAEKGGAGEGVETVLPRALHRFTFRKGTEGDRAFVTNFGEPPFVGSDFINGLGLGFSIGGGQIRYEITAAGERRGGSLTVPQTAGKGAEIPLHLGEPTALGGVSVVAGFSTGSRAPLVLPGGMGFPRFEIPGTATLTGGSNHPGAMRRYVASVSIPALGLREVFVEAIGQHVSLELPDGTLRVGGHVWQPDSDEVRAGARKAGRLVLLLERPRWMQAYPGNPFARDAAGSVRADLLPYTLVWRELATGASWVGSGDASPPAEARLTVVDPGASNRVVRQLVLRPWTQPGAVSVLLAAGWRELRTTDDLDHAIAKNEATALEVLRSLIRAQAHLQASGALDSDRDGMGEYGTLADLTRSAPGRMSTRPDPPRLPNSFAPKQGADVLVLEGYRFQLYLPGVGGTATARQDGSDVDPDGAERAWWALAWPETLGATGRRTFYVDQEGVIWTPGPEAGAYEGTASPPAADAAFADPGRYPGGVSPVLVSADGHRWAQVR
ncbi:MAG: hypothetical protein O2894_01705 [Planctomycetota bacterium]|nr:hypothetical protein [Planctomycetota bacterium]